jgi:hypothetical protein
MYDSVLAQWDKTIFSVNPTEWIYQFSNPILTEWLQFSYMTYYVMPLILGLEFIFGNKENEFDYLIADENCKQAVMQLVFVASKVKWLKIYKKLYDKVTIHPEGLPRIINANFNGVRYDFIIDFCREYQIVEQEITN